MNMTDLCNRKYGYLKSKTDIRDFMTYFTDDHVKAFLGESHIPTVFDLRTVVKLPQALSDIDQGNLGSCTANAIAFAYAFDELKQGNHEIFLPSRLFIYYNERMMEGSVDTDAGAEIRDGMKSINRYGVCDEHHWIYDLEKFREKPSKEIYEEAKLAKSLTYAKIDFSKNETESDRIMQLKKSILSGFPFVFGFAVYASFETEEVAKTGMVPMPKPNEEMVGGHAVCAVGFDDEKQCFLIKNSYGPNWGLDNYFYMPYAYVSDPRLCDDFWVLRQVTDPNNIPGFTPGDIEPIAKNLNADVSGGGVVHSQGRYCVIV